MLRTGLLSGDGVGASLLHNSSNHYEDRWVRLGVESTISPFLDGDEPIDLAAVDATLVANKQDEEAIRQVVAKLKELGWDEHL